MNDDEFSQPLQSKTNIPAKIIIIIAVAAIVAIAAGVLVIFGKSTPTSSRNKIVTMTDSSLQKMLQTSELQTVDFVYNAIAQAPTEDGLAIKYYVAYEGDVKAGIDFSNVEVSIDDENKIITISIPKVEIQDCTVNAGTLDFIFLKDKYNTATVASEAYEISLADLKNRVGRETKLLNIAEENAVSTVKGLIEPWINQVKNEYSVEVKVVQ